MAKHKIILLIVFALALCQTASSQTLQGKVIEKTATGEHPVVGTTIYWINTSTGTITGKNGKFKIKANSIRDKRLIVSHIGYQTDTISGTNKIYIIVSLKEKPEALGKVTVTGSSPGQYISPIAPIKTEIITQKELTKGACCDLAGCFGTNASVQPTVTNVVTNSTELRILGLSGIYNQTLFDGLPLIQGLSFTYGISSIPGTLVDKIDVAKGITSVLQGYESISGQINVEPKEPDKTNKLLFNAYMNSFFEKQFNLNYATPVGKRHEWSNLIALHTTQPANKIDKDRDTFLDLPLLTRYLFYDKLKYRDDKSFGWHSQIGLMYLNEQRIGGQTSFDPSTDKGSSTVYGQTVNIHQPTIYTKSGYRFNDNNAIAFLGDFYLQKQDSWFGQTHYVAQQHSGYANLQYELKWRGKHDFKTGVSFRYFYLNENISFTANPLKKTFAGDYLKNEMIPGIFAENIFNWKDYKYQLITGVRLDHHNMYGTFFTPRTMLKIQAAGKTTLRASVGTGWRTANIFSENINLLASQRDIIFPEKLKPEQAINFGFSIVQGFDTKNITGSISADFYRTQFQNQIFPDYNADPTKAYIYNFTGISVSNSSQVDLNAEFYNVFTVKISYNYLDVFRNMNGQRITLPFNPLHKVLTSLSYEPLSEKWHLDANAHWYGKQVLPNTFELPTGLQRTDRSKPYGILNAQYTYNFKDLEVYGGCENIFDYRQKYPIISWQNPFSPYFDTSSIWGPTMGREWYIGARFKLK